MIHLCTVTDEKYLLKGLALYRSLRQRLESGFVLHWLAIDDASYDALLALRLDGVVAYRLAHLEEVYPELRSARNNKPSQLGTQYDNFCWLLAPWFTNHVLHADVHADQFLIYVDSDIFFFQSPSLILGALGTKSIGIHTHRFGGVYTEEHTVGWYNVGVVVFRKNAVGVKVSDSWKAWLLDQNNPFYEKYGSCGDQKYLELFIRLFGRDNVCVFDEDAAIGHLAPWNCDDVTLYPDGHVGYDGRICPLVFFHFSHFVFDFEESTWADSIEGEWNPAQGAIVPLYEDYFSEMRIANSLLLAAAPPEAFRKAGRFPAERSTAGSEGE